MNDKPDYQTYTNNPRILRLLRITKISAAYSERDIRAIVAYYDDRIRRMSAYRCWEEGVLTNFAYNAMEYWLTCPYPLWMRPSVDDHRDMVVPLPFERVPTLRRRRRAAQL